jgi:prepilin-type N-terminal cleavage/methylation domain-containing protein
MNRKSRSRGFTLVEMMVTIVIIAILAVVAGVAYSKYTRKAKNTEAVTVLSDIKMKQVTYYQTYAQYVDTTGGGGAGCNFNDSDFYPPNVDGGDKKWEIKCPDDQDAYPGWCALGAKPTGETTDFQYVSVGGTVDEGCTPPETREGKIFIKNPNAGDGWWYAEARRHINPKTSEFTQIILTSEFEQPIMFNETF